MVRGPELRAMMAARCVMCLACALHHFLIYLFSLVSVGVFSLAYEIVALQAS